MGVKPTLLQSNNLRLRDPETLGHLSLCQSNILSSLSEL